jgi:hypothetical protein
MVPVTRRKDSYFILSVHVALNNRLNLPNLLGDVHVAIYAIR